MSASRSFYSCKSVISLTGISRVVSAMRMRRHFGKIFFELCKSAFAVSMSSQHGRATSALYETAPLVKSAGARFTGRRYCSLLIGIMFMFMTVSDLRANAQIQPRPVGREVYVNAQVSYHPAVLDSQGHLLAWYGPEKNMGYDKVLHLGWDFIEHKVPLDTRTKTGLPIYLINSVFDGDTLQGWNWQDNPAMVYASFVDSLVGWYPYSGDGDAV